MRQSEMFIKQKMDLAFEDEMVNLKRHMDRNEKVTCWQFMKE